MGDKAWKQLERRVASWLGTVRIGPSGDDGPDLISDHFAVQCKHRASLPKWLLGAVDNAVDGAREGRAGFAYLKEKFSRDDDDLIVFKKADFAQLITYTDLDAYVEARNV